MARDEISARVTLEGGKEVAKELQGIGKEADKLDGTKIELPIEADTKKADRDIAGLMSKVEKLGGDAGTILLTSNATEIAGEIADLIIDIDRLDASDPTVDVKATQINALQGDLDQIEAKIREVNSVPIEVDTRRAKTGIDEVGKSADSSKSVLANMVGNATQDLGALGGIAGSAGVAIGQMGEYMVDAAADGDKLGNIVGNFAKIAGPVAALALGTQVLSNYMGDNKEAADQSAKSIKDWKDAIEGGGDAAAAFAADLAETGKIFLNLSSVSDDLSLKLRKQEENWTGLTGAWHAVFGGGGPLRDMAPLFEKAGLTVEQFTQAVTGGTKGQKAWAEVVKASNLPVDEQEELLALLTQEQVNYGKATSQSSRFQKIFGAAVDDSADAIDSFIKAHKPMDDLPRTWEAVMNGAERMRQGLQPTSRQLQAARVIAEQYGISVADAFERGSDAIDDHAAAVDEAVGKVIDGMKEWRDEGLKAQQAVSDALDNITEQWQAMSDAVSEQSFADALDQFDALSELDLSQVRQDTVGAFDDVKEAIKTAAGEVKGWGKMDLTPDSFKELKGMPAAFADITDAVSAMRGSIQTELKAAFDTGGVQAFSEKFDFFAGQVRQQFTDLFRGMGLPENQVQAQVQRILGDLSLLPESKTILIKLTRDQEAKNTLDLFMADIATIENANPSVDIRAKIAEGDIEGAYDELNALRISEGKEPIVLPTDAEQYGAAQAAANARKRAQDFLTRYPVLVPVGADGRNVPSDTMNARNSGQNTANANPIRIPVYVQTIDIGGGQFRRGQVIISDAGGTIPPGAAGLVAEKRPEILNGRYLATQPTLVPSGTRVTSGARTARILRRRGARGLKPYDSGGTVAAGPSTVNVNFNGVGAIGSRFDLMRTVKRANLDRTRLLGTRG